MKLTGRGLLSLINEALEDYEEEPPEEEPLPLEEPPEGEPPEGELPPYEEEPPEEEPPEEELPPTDSLLAPEELKIWQDTLIKAAKKSGLDVSHQPDELEEASNPKITQRISLPQRGSEESGFCRDVPKIMEFSKKNPDNLAETILFVFASMQTPWPKLVPYFRFIVDLIKYSDEGLSDFVKFVKKPHRNITQTDAPVYKYYVFRHNLANGTIKAKDESKGSYSVFSHKKKYKSYRKLKEALSGERDSKAKESAENFFAQQKVKYKEDYIKAKEIYKKLLPPLHDYRRETIYKIYMRANDIPDESYLTEDQKNYIDVVKVELRVLVKKIILIRPRGSLGISVPPLSPSFM